MKSTALKLGFTLATCVALVVGCSSSGSGGDKPKQLESVGDGEGQLNLIAWAGYVEDGSTDPKVDWVTPFEQKTGCEVNVKIGNTSDEMVTLMRTGRYDGVSASGDATLRLIAGGDVPRSTPTSSRTTPTSSRRSRTSPSTRSTGRCTASRTGAGRTC